MRTSRPSDPFWWLLFAAGGTVAAFALPALIVLIGIVAPSTGNTGAFRYERIYGLAASWVGRILLFGLITLFFFHWAHRFRSTVVEGFGFKGAGPVIAVLCYGAAIVGAVAAAVVVASL